MTAVGTSALQGDYTYMTTEASRAHSGSVAVGYGAGTRTTGSYNTFVGYEAGRGTSAASGENNVAIGKNAMKVFTSAYSMVAVGKDAGQAVTTAKQSVFVGQNAGYAITSGITNTFIGHDAGDGVQTGNSNICIGYNTETSANNSTYQIVIGDSITGGENDQFTFGKASNIVQNEFDTDAAWTRTSDVRKKRNIKDDILGLEFINKLRPVTHQWKPSNEFPKEWDEYSEENNMNLDATMHGLIAQEVKEALDDVGVDTFSGWKERKDGSQTVSREMFITPLINAVKELSSEKKELRDELNELKIFIKKKLGDE